MSQQPSNWGQTPQYIPPSGKTSMLAVFALVLGVLGCIPPLGLIGIGLGVAAIVVINNSQGRLTGQGLAVGGIVSGGIMSLFILPLMLGILLPALGAARRTARQMQGITQIRGIHQALIIEAQENEGYYAGLDRDGAFDLNHVFNGDPQVAPYDHPSHPAWRLRRLLEANHFAGAVTISPSETKTLWQSGPVTPENYSYALLDIADLDDPRVAEWRETNQAQAPIISDRLVVTAGVTHSVHDRKRWRGGIAWNDNHVSFEPDEIVDTVYGRQKNSDDNLFAPTSGDAYMVYDQP
jgi:hypothetical protein